MLFSVKKINLIFSFIFFLAVSPFSLIAQKADFSGIWKLDKDRTDFGKVFPAYTTPYVMKVDQQRDSLMIERNSKDGQGELHNYVEKLPFDGHVIENMIKSTKKRAMIQWSIENQSLTETATYKDYSAGMEYKATEIWTLTDEGKTLMITRQDEGQDGNDIRRMIYTR